MIRVVAAACHSSFTLAVPGLPGVLCLPVEGILANSASDALAQAGQSRSEQPGRSIHRAPLVMALSFDRWGCCFPSFPIYSGCAWPASPLSPVGGILTGSGSDAQAEAGQSRSDKAEKCLSSLLRVSCLSPGSLLAPTRPCQPICGQNRKKESQWSDRPKHVLGLS